MSVSDIENGHDKIYLSVFKCLKKKHVLAVPTAEPHLRQMLHTQSEAESSSYSDL